jgi:hypothetical protein
VLGRFETRYRSNVRGNGGLDGAAPAHAWVRARCALRVIILLVI